MHTCGVCRYKYFYYYDYDKQRENQEKPFVKMEEPLFYEVSRPWEGSRLERITQYVCPVCGVVQVDTNSLEANV